MKSPLTLTRLTAEDKAVEFFQDSVGHWRSERRYYTLSKDVIQEVVSHLRISFLEGGSSELAALSEAHGLSRDALPHGVSISWESEYLDNQKRVTGSTVFGVLGNLLYRDRGFATPKPVTAHYSFPRDRTMVLRTEYSGSVFEEEVKLISSNYRTRQTIISRAGEEQMIGQYLERRLHS